KRVGKLLELVAIAVALLVEGAAQRAGYSREILASALSSALEGFIEVVQTSVGVEDAKLWAAELEKLRRGTACVFLNKFEEAEKIFRSGIFANSEYDMLPVPARGHDLRPAYAFQWALASLVWLTEKLAAESPDQWVGQRFLRGMCYMFGGIVQILQQSFVKAGVNLTRSWTWIKSMEKE
ncbi:hypothetical protein FOZ62_016465, partial [Perkinsus olseni]